jgi:hypothetical protein
MKHDPENARLGLVLVLGGWLPVLVVGALAAWAVGVLG